MPESKFPDGFIWGAATASYQIEGAANEDGRGPSVWDTFSHTPGKVANGETGDIACDHYHRYPEDVKLMTDIGLKSYRFSVSWSRLYPEGTGTLNPKGVDFYSRLVDELLEANVEPMITLFHWDYPQALEDRGGWAHPDARHWFGDYAETVFRHLGDRVKHWVTLNEPWCFAWLGNGCGAHAPGNADPALAYKVAHGLLLGHGSAVQRFRALGKPGRIGMTTNHSFAMPASDDPKDLQAKAQFDDWNVGWFLDPVYFGDYPEYLKCRYPMPAFTPETSALVSQKTDFLGMNFYYGDKVRWNPERMNDAEQFPIRIDSVTQMGWTKVPESLTYNLVETQRRYDPSLIIITENGCAYDDQVTNGVVKDPLRKAFLREYIKAAADALDQGVKLGGYFVWSLLDNFEWAQGYTPRFGIFRVDYDTLKRIPKESAFMYRDIIQANAVPHQ